MKLLTSIFFTPVLLGFAGGSYVQVTDANGNVYVGEFKDDEYNGQETIIYADQSRYVGEWRLLADHLVAAEY